MKSMTCRQLGGPCDLAHRGETADAAIADAVIKAQDHHLREVEKSGDSTHQQAREVMKGRWRRPRQAWGWYRDTGRAFAELPES